MASTVLYKVSRCASKAIARCAGQTFSESGIANVTGSSLYEKSNLTCITSDWIAYSTVRES